MMLQTEPVQVGTAVAAMIRDGRFDEAEEMFAPRLSAVVSARSLRSAWTAELARVGQVERLGEPVSRPGAEGLTTVIVPVVCERGGLSIHLGIDSSGVLHGLRLAAPEGAWSPPPYVRHQRFTEQDLTLGSVNAALTLPAGRGGPWPAVVLLSGGGPFDKDGTAGPNKPLKDLAWGLSSRGVAVLRFDKSTHSNAGLMSEPGFTVTQEYLPPALAAIELLRRHPNVAADRVFLAGHSMGGKIAPRIAEAEPSVAGLVLLAGEAAAMHHAYVRVARYITSSDPDSAASDPDSAAAVARAVAQAALVDDPGLSPAVPASELPLGYPASYWLDLRDYDPVTTAAALGKPMLILQGGRDYQVTVEDDLALWQAGLSGRPDVTFRVYPADNHMFYPGTGRSTPSDYDQPQHVDPAAIADIASWVAPRTGWLRRLRTR